MHRSVGGGICLSLRGACDRGEVAVKVDVKTAVEVGGTSRGEGSGGAKGCSGDGCP